MDDYGASIPNNKRRAEVRALFAKPSSPETAPPSLAGMLSHYELLRRIGKGARGVVYLARDRRLDRLVALKVLQHSDNAESGQRFRREAQCASAINHPNVVTIYESGSDRGIDFIVMEHIAGRTLDRIIPGRGLKLRICIEFGLQMAQALAALHYSGVIHRDIKPSNFVVTKRGLVKLLDFGLAKFAGLAQMRRSSHARAFLETQEGAILGTANYMSPEQVAGQKVDFRSDVFSFGVVLYEMLTGRRPFQASTTIETMNATLRKPAPPLPRRIPGSLAAIVRRSLTKKVDERYKSATELCAALLRFAEGIKLQGPPSRGR